MTSEQEIRNKQFKQVTGSAPNFRAIDGVGPKTAEKVKDTFIEGQGRVQAPTDVQDLTDDELAKKAGISQNRARKVIKGAGGNPDRKPRSTTGSVSAAGIRVPVGDFNPEISDNENAKARFETSLNRGIGRSQNAAIADKSKRAPVTTDLDRWKENKGELDFPGVDTPSDDPQVLPKDLRQEQRPATTDPPEPTTTQSRPGSMPMVKDESAAGFGEGYGTVGQELRLTAASRAPEPVDVGEEAAGSMIADGMGGVAFDRNTGGYRETDRPEKDETPPDIARGEDPFDMSNSGGALDDSTDDKEVFGEQIDSEDRSVIRKLERSSAATGERPEQIERLRFEDDPPEQAREAFVETADTLLGGRNAIENDRRTDVDFFESDTIDRVETLRNELAGGRR